VIPGFVIALVGLAVSRASTPLAAGDQGCVNQGSDRRLLAGPVCWAQRQLSWKSDIEPHFLSLEASRIFSVGIAWPPYLVVNRQVAAQRWQMFRVGIRYDRNWHGYIVPTMALKVLSQPLRY
jgi:hypothetical protein